MKNKAICIGTIAIPKEIIAKLKKRPLVWDTISTTFFSTIGKAVGFLIPFFIAAWFGVTSETDAFFFSYGLTLFLAGIFAPVVESVIVPYIAEARSKNEDVGDFVGRVLGVSVIGLIALAGLFLMVIKPILSLITHFDQQTLDLAYSLLIATAPLVILLVLTSILAGTLNAYKKFAFPALSPAFRAIVNLTIIFAFKDTLGVYAIAAGYVVGETLRFLVLLGIIYKLRLFSLHFSFGFSSKIKEFIKTASFQIFGMVAVGLNPIVDKTMASWLGKGSVSILHYADRLYFIPITFISTGLMVTLLSHWSSHYYESGLARLNRDLKKALKLIAPVALAITIGLILFYQPIVRLAFGRGAFARENLSAVGWVWLCYLFGFVPYMMGLIYTRAHLTLKNTKALLKCALYLNGLNIFFNYILMRYLGVAGIALATTLISVFTPLYLMHSLRKKLALGD